MLVKAALFILAFLANPVTSTEKLPNIVEIAQSNSELFSTLVQAVSLAGLLDTLSCESRKCTAMGFTVFAPNNDAFAALGDTLDKLLMEEYRRHLKNVLLFHVAPGTRPSSTLGNGRRVQTVLGEPVVTTSSDQTILVNDASVFLPDVRASNGIVHGIDGVLVPSFLKTSIADIVSKMPNFSTLLAAAIKSDVGEVLADTSGTFTVFAPTNAAFAALGDNVVENTSPEDLATILLYHVIEDSIVFSDELKPGSVTTLGGEDIQVSFDRKTPMLNGNVGFVKTDVFASNGVIHVIDAVLLPPSTPPPLPSLVELAVNTPKLSILVQAVTQADLVGALSGEGPLTVFAPTNDAFVKTGIDLDNVPMDVLVNILTYHVVAGKVTRSDLSSGVVTALNGDPINVMVRRKGKRFRLNGNANVVKFDIMASNGVVHVIDKVLMPPPMTVFVPMKGGKMRMGGKMMMMSRKIRSKGGMMMGKMSGKMKGGTIMSKKGGMMMSGKGGMMGGGMMY